MDNNNGAKTGGPQTEAETEKVKRLKEINRKIAEMREWLKKFQR